MSRIKSKIRHETLNILLCVITLVIGLLLLWCVKEKLHGTNILFKITAVFLAFAIPASFILLAMRIFMYFRIRARSNKEE